MNKKFLFVSILCFIVSFVFAQKFSATVVPGSTENSVKVRIQPNGNITGQVSSMQLTLIVPKSVSPSVRPLATIGTNFIPGVSYPAPATNLEWTGRVPGASVDSTFYVYIFDGIGDNSVASTSYVSGTPYDVIEVKFDNGPLGIRTRVRVAQIPDGTTNGGGTNSSQANFYMALGGNDVTNETAQFIGPGAFNSGTGYTGFSFSGLDNITLPVKFLSFYAIKNGDNAKLNWTVESDENNKYFDIERSIDGRNFKPHAKVDAKGNGKSINTYETADFNLSKVGSPVIYYRIKQVDKNGEITFSNIRNLNADRNGVPASIFPNPTKNTTRLVVDADGAGKASVVVRDINGKMVKQINIQLVKGLNQQDLNVADLASGEYSITVFGEGFSHQLKMTKIN